MKKFVQIAALLIICLFTAQLAQAQVVPMEASSSRVNLVPAAAVQGAVIGANGAENTTASGVLIGASTGVVAGGYNQAAAQPAIGVQENQAAGIPHTELAK